MRNSKKVITLEHGNGGKLSHDLIKNLFLREFENQALSDLADSALLKVEEARLLFSTDSHVIKPIFFPGGDIGKLAVSGTVNDLVVMGALPLYLSVGMIIEEGFPLAELEEICASMQKTALKAGVQLVTGDTKVVEKGGADRIFINTSGIGILPEDYPVFSPERVQEGDVLIINGNIGDHGVAVLTAREDFPIETDLKSDVAPLTGLIRECLEAVPPDAIRVMRDPTRGGLATTLNEFAEGRDFTIEIDENSLPVRDEVKAICEMAGYDPLYMANEGKVVMLVSADYAEKIVDIMRKCENGRDAAIIGRVSREMPGRVILRTQIGGSRIVDMLVGNMLPRIC